MASQRKYQKQFDILHITSQADAQLIKRQYRKLALKNHPDKNPKDREGAEQRFKAIANAYDCLNKAFEDGEDINAWIKDHDGFSESTSSISVRTTKQGAQSVSSSSALTLYEDFNLEDLIKKAHYTSDDLIAFLSKFENFELATKAIKDPQLARYVGKYDIYKLGLASEALAELIIKTDLPAFCIFDLHWKKIAEKFPQACQLILKSSDICEEFSGLVLIRLVEVHGDVIENIVLANPDLDQRYQAGMTLNLYLNEKIQLTLPEVKQLIFDANLDASEIARYAEKNDAIAELVLFDDFLTKLISDHHFFGIMLKGERFAKRVLALNVKLSTHTYALIGARYPSLIPMIFAKENSREMDGSDLYKLLYPEFDNRKVAKNHREKSLPQVLEALTTRPELIERFEAYNKIIDCVLKCMSDTGYANSDAQLQATIDKDELIRLYHTSGITGYEMLNLVSSSLAFFDSVIACEEIVKTATVSCLSDAAIDNIRACKLVSNEVIRTKWQYADADNSIFKVMRKYPQACKIVLESEIASIFSGAQLIDLMNTQNNEVTNIILGNKKLHPTLESHYAIQGIQGESDDHDRQEQGQSVFADPDYWYQFALSALARGDDKCFVDFYAKAIEEKENVAIEHIDKFCKQGAHRDLYEKYILSNPSYNDLWNHAFKLKCLKVLDDGVTPETASFVKEVYLKAFTRPDVEHITGKQIVTLMKAAASYQFILPVFGYITSQSKELFPFIDEYARREANVWHDLASILLTGIQNDDALKKNKDYFFDCAYLPLFQKALENEETSAIDEFDIDLFIEANQLQPYIRANPERLTLWQNAIATKMSQVLSQENISEEEKDFLRKACPIVLQSEVHEILTNLNLMTLITIFLDNHALMDEILAHPRVLSVLESHYSESISSHTSENAEQAKNDRWYMLAKAAFKLKENHWFLALYKKALVNKESLAIEYCGRFLTHKGLKPIFSQHVKTDPEMLSSFLTALAEKVIGLLNEANQLLDNDSKEAKKRSDKKFNAVYRLLKVIFEDSNLRHAFIPNMNAQLKKHVAQHPYLRVFLQKDSPALDQKEIDDSVAEIKDANRKLNAYIKKRERQIKSWWWRLFHNVKLTQSKLEFTKQLSASLDKLLVVGPKTQNEKSEYRAYGKLLFTNYRKINAKLSQVYGKKKPGALDKVLEKGSRCIGVAPCA